MGPGGGPMINQYVGNTYGQGTQYSHRGEELSFLSKLAQQAVNNGRSDEQAVQSNSNRGFQGMYLGSGVGSHAPNGVQMSLNSPKYGQGLSFISQSGVPGNNPQSPSGASGD